MAPAALCPRSRATARAARSVPPGVTAQAAADTPKGMRVRPVTGMQPEAPRPTAATGAAGMTAGEHKPKTPPGVPVSAKHAQEEAGDGNDSPSQALRSRRRSAFSRRLT